MRFRTSLPAWGLDMAVYKIGDKYVGARSHEFGFANYEIVPEPANLLDLSKSKKN